MQLFPRAEFVLEIPEPVAVVRERLRAQTRAPSFLPNFKSRYNGTIQDGSFFINAYPCQMRGRMEGKGDRATVHVELSLKDWESGLAVGALMMGVGGAAMFVFLGFYLVLFACIPLPIRFLFDRLMARSRFNAARCQLACILRGDQLFG